jgi:amino-acid N-acetyltransferase
MKGLENQEFVKINEESLKSLKLILKQEQLCFDDINLESDQYFGLFDKHQKLIAGYGLEVYQSNALLRSVVVNQKHRNSGIGKIIIQHAIEYGLANEIKNYYLLTTTADHFFSKFGFYVIDRDSVPGRIGSTEEFRTFCPDTAICMRLTLKNNST